MSSEDRFIVAANQFCEQERMVRQLGRDLPRCREASAGDPSIGDSGTFPCWMVEEMEEKCADCTARLELYPKLVASKKSRKLAKERMMRAFTGLSDQHRAKGDGGSE